jgi:hypothetical protein
MASKGSLFSLEDQFAFYVSTAATGCHARAQSPAKLPLPQGQYHVNKVRFPLFQPTRAPRR